MQFSPMYIKVHYCEHSLYLELGGQQYHVEMVASDWLENKRDIGTWLSEDQPMYHRSTSWHNETEKEWPTNLFE